MPSKARATIFSDLSEGRAVAVEEVLAMGAVGEAEEVVEIRATGSLSSCLVAIAFASSRFTCGLVAGRPTKLPEWFDET